MAASTTAAGPHAPTHPAAAAAAATATTAAAAAAPATATATAAAAAAAARVTATATAPVVHPYKEVLAGSVAALASTVVCHPIDVLRTELQTQARATTATACLRRIVGAEGAAGLYKGLSAPLAAQAVYKAVIFGANSAAQKALLARRRQSGHKKRGRPESSTAASASTSAGLLVPRLTYADIFACGAAAGAANALVVAPVELVRNRLVVLKGRYGGPMDCARDIVRHEGGLPALWRGLVPTLWRDGPGVGAWFLAFAWGKDALLQRKAQRLQGPGPPTAAAAPTLGLGELLAAGSAAGVAFWTVALPFDTVKAVVQVQAAGAEERGMLAVGWRLVREEGGPRRLFRGWQGAFGRAVPGSAATLAVFDIVKEKL